jgi:hypothetical protein
MMMCTVCVIGLGLNGTRPDDKLPYGGAWLDVGTGELVPRIGVSCPSNRSVSEHTLIEA